MSESGQSTVLPYPVCMIAVDLQEVCYCMKHVICGTVCYFSRRSKIELLVSPRRRHPAGNRNMPRPCFRERKEEKALVGVRKKEKE